MYKDRQKQRIAVKEATRRYRAKLKGITVTPSLVIPVIPKDVPCDTQVCGSNVIPAGDTQYGWGCDTKEEAIALAQTLDVMEQEDGPEIVKQSHNPMMVGYEPPVEV